MNAPPFQNRWRILGTITTLSELHLGDGGTGELNERTRLARQAQDEEHQIQTVCVDHDGTAYLPSSSIRGALRSLMIQDGKWSDQRWDSLFGSPNPDGDNAVGGKLIFYDSFWQKQSGYAKTGDEVSHPYWSATRRTCVATSVSLDRRRRTAADGLLYQREYVPTGEVFELEIGAENVSEDDIAHLLALLQRLNPVNALPPVHLGGLVSNDWGRVRWELTAVECFSRDDLVDWLQLADGPVGIQMTKPVPDTLRQALVTKAARLVPTLVPDRLEIDLELHLTSPWIVRDARQKKRLEDFNASKKQGHKQRKDLDEVPPVGATPMLDEQGRPFIPAKSFRGLLRSQAERILRTLGVEVPPPEQQPVISARTNRADALHQVAQLDLATRLFGVSGWRAPLEPTRFVVPNTSAAPQLLQQEFVAVDRFTGGAADALKFNAEFAAPCTLKGSLKLDLTRLGQVDPLQTARGLLALLLRDLQEGDLAPGAHAAIGCGACSCTAVITDSGQTYASLRDWFASQPVQASLKAFRQSIPRNHQRS